MTTRMRNIRRIPAVILILFAAILCIAAAIGGRARILLIGDSTMADKPLAGNPERGWGQLLPRFFDTDVTVRNFARNGRSTKSFVSEGLWEKVCAEMKPGDYLLIQFGHNNEPGKPGRSTESMLSGPNCTSVGASPSIRSSSTMAGTIRKLSGNSTPGSQTDSLP